MVVGAGLGQTMESLNKTLGAVKDQLVSIIQFADKAQQVSLALGMTYEQTSTALGGTMEGLRGDLSQRFQAGIMGLEAGLHGNTAGVARLINQQQLTNTSFARTATAFATLEATLGTTREQTNRLADSLPELGRDYQISTDKLVDAIDKLKATFPAQALAGMGDKVVGAVATLQGELKASMAGPLNNVMTMIMDTSMKGYERLIQLGIGDVRERLSASKDAAEAQAILKDAIVRAAGRFEGFTGDASKLFVKLGVAGEILGQQAIQFTTVAKGFGEEQVEQKKDLVDFGKTLSNLKREILVPFGEAFARFYEPLVTAFDALSLVARRVVEKFSSFIDDEVIGKSKNLFKDITVAIIDASIFMINAFDSARIVVIDFANGFFKWVIVPLKDIGNAVDALVIAFKEAADTLSFGYFEYDSQQAQSDILALVNNIAENEKAKKKGLSSSDLGNRLLGDIKESIENDEKLNRQNNRYLEKIRDNTAKPVELSNQFLDETVNILGRSVEGILGIGANDNSAEIAELLGIVAENTGVRAEEMLRAQPN